MINRLDNVNWITPEFLDKVKMYRLPPYTDLKVMEKLSSVCKCILCYFHNILRYKEIYDSVEPVLKKSQQATVIAETALAKKEELENKIKILSETQSQLQKEYNNS